MRKPFLMLLVLLALGGYLFFVEFPRQQKEVEQKKLLTFDKEAVTEITLTYPDRAVTLKKNDAGRWRITQPVDATADDTTVNNLVGSLADAEIKRTLDGSAGDTALYGLNAPTVKVQVGLKEGKLLPLVTLGKDTPVGFSVYAQKAGESQILLVPQTLRLGMTKELKDLRDRTVLTFNDDEVKKLVIRRPDSEIIINKVEPGWELEKPVVAKADESEVRTLMSNLRSIRAQDFIEEPMLDLKEFGLDPPQLAIALTVGEEGSQKEILLGGEKSTDSGGTNRYLKRAGQEKPLFLVGDWVWRDLSKTATDFLDKTIANFSQEQVAKVEVKRLTGEGFTLTREAENTWHIDKTGEGTVHEPALSQFVADLRELRGFEIAAQNPTDLSTYGLQDPAVRITISDKEGKKLATILAGQREEGEAKKSFAMTEGSQTVFGIRDYVFDRLNKTPSDFWEKATEKKESGPSSSAESSGVQEDTPSE